jgi:hypothetical protein
MNKYTQIGIGLLIGGLMAIVFSMSKSTSSRSGSMNELSKTGTVIVDHNALTYIQNDNTSISNIELKALSTLSDVYEVVTIK